MRPTQTKTLGGASVSSDEAHTQAAWTARERGQRRDRLPVVASAMSTVADALTQGTLTAELVLVEGHTA